VTQARALGLQVLAGRFRADDPRRSGGLGPVLEELAGHLRSLPAELGARLGGPGARRLQALAPGFAFVGPGATAAVPPDAATTDAAPAQDAELAELAAAALCGFARHDPCLVALEDVDWADAEPARSWPRSPRGSRGARPRVSSCSSPGWRRPPGPHRSRPRPSVLAARRHRAPGRVDARPAYPARAAGRGAAAGDRRAAAPERAGGAGAGRARRARLVAGPLAAGPARVAALLPGERQAAAEAVRRETLARLGALGRAARG